MKTNETALISGASKGIGRETAAYFAQNKINLILVARDFEALKNLANEFTEKNKIKAVPVSVDISNQIEIENKIRDAIEKIGGIDFLINLAGYPLDISLWKKMVHELKDDEILKIMHVDFFGSLRLVRECIPYMIKNKKGVIINISSIPAIDGDIEGAAYAFSKSCCITLTKFIARQYGAYNIRAYTVALGSIKTNSTYDKLTELEKNQLAKETSLKRWGEPIEIAKLIYALTRDDFSFVNGQTIIADGGVVMH